MLFLWAHLVPLEDSSTPLESGYLDQGKPIGDDSGRIGAC